jgi:hypothetical protein
MNEKLLININNYIGVNSQYYNKKHCESDQNIQLVSIFCANRKKVLTCFEF